MYNVTQEIHYITLYSHNTRVHSTLLDVLHVLGLSVVTKLFVSPINSSLVFPATARSPPHRARHAHLPC